MSVIIGTGLGAYKISQFDISFTADLYEIEQCSSTTLRWEIIDEPDEAYLDNGSETIPIDAVGTLEVSPRKSTTYTITATLDSVTIIKTVTISVKTIEIVFVSDPTEINIGEISVLTWNIKNAERAVLQYDSETIGINLDGSLEVNPIKDTIYKIKAYTSCTSKSNELTVKIIDLEPEFKGKTIDAIEATPTKLSTEKISEFVLRKNTFMIDKFMVGIGGHNEQFNTALAVDITLTELPNDIFGYKKIDLYRKSINEDLKNNFELVINPTEINYPFISNIGLYATITSGPNNGDVFLYAIANFPPIYINERVILNVFIK